MNSYGIDSRRPQLARYTFHLGQGARVRTGHDLVQNGPDAGQIKAEFGPQDAHDHGLACRRIHLEQRWAPLGQQPTSKLSRQIAIAGSYRKSAGRARRLRIPA
ncbi:hypothetical protein [Streptomyces parvus]|uniref:hypothetical protein n=1 Tax=Streptomyces parvus TaxID=66428 RepID=UPI0035DE4634